MQRPIDILAAPLIVLLSLPATAQESDVPPGWRCESCLLSSGWDIDLTVGTAYSNEDSFEFGDYTGLDDDGFYLVGDVLALFRDADGNLTRGNYIDALVSPIENYFYDPTYGDANAKNNRDRSFADINKVNQKLYKRKYVYI